MVDGKRVAIETKPLELLHELLLNAGALVPKSQLMDKAWPDVQVVEASLPTAIGKLRRAIGDDRRDRPIIETVPRLGYRLAATVEVDHLPDPLAGNAAGSAAAAPVKPTVAGGRRAGDGNQAKAFGRPAWVLAATAAIVSVGIAAALALASQLPSSNADAKPRAYTKGDVMTALRKTDIEAMERMLAAGWDPNVPLDIDRNGAVNLLLNNCEWDPGHDKRRMLLAVRTLIDGGARVTERNVWGDTPYSIAKAERYCGPDHPATRMIHMMCYEGPTPYAERCEADYVRDASGRVIRQDPPQRAK